MENGVPPATGWCLCYEYSQHYEAVVAKDINLVYQALKINRSFCLSGVKKRCCSRFSSPPPLGCLSTLFPVRDYRQGSHKKNDALYET